MKQDKVQSETPFGPRFALCVDEPLGARASADSQTPSLGRLATRVSNEEKLTLSRDVSHLISSM